MIEIERDRFGRPLIPPPDDPDGKGVGYTRVTTISEVQADRFNLEKYLQRQVIKGLVADPSLMPLAQRAGDDKKVLNRLVEDAHDAARSSEKAEKGTALHDILYKVATRQDVEIPAEWSRHVAEWERVTRDWHFACLEQMVIHDGYQYAGTPDAIAIVPSVTPTQPIIVDYKTGSTIDFGFREMAAQLAMYANADHLYEYGGEQGRQGMPPDLSLTKGLIVHLPENGGGAIRLYQIDLIAGWKAAKRSIEIREWRRNKLDDITKIIDCGDPVEEWLRRRILRLAAIPEAATLLVSHMKPEYGTLGGGLNLDHEEEMNTILTKLEDVHQMPFAERHPLTPTRRGKKK